MSKLSSLNNLSINDNVDAINDKTSSSPLSKNQLSTSTDLPPEIHHTIITYLSHSTLKSLPSVSPLNLKTTKITDNSFQNPSTYTSPPTSLLPPTTLLRGSSRQTTITKCLSVSPQISSIGNFTNPSNIYTPTPWQVSPSEERSD
jgi:hypothetical protein